MYSIVESDLSSSDDDMDMELLPMQRTFRPRVNFEIVSDFVFMEKFRISTVTAEELLSRIGMYLRHDTNRNNALTPVQQLLTCLHWLGGGGQYHGIRDMHGLSKATVYRCVHRVCTAIINHVLLQEVRWPTQDVCSVPHQFMQARNFPRIAGCVDGTLVPIDAPHQNEAAYVDRNNNHSINAMLVSGPNLEFFYVSARWPGSVHDARVLRNSSLATQWNNGWRPFPNAVILGDSAYPLKELLIPPVVNGHVNDAAKNFLRAHKSTRRMVENSFGIVKEKFPCLNYLRLQPLAACNVILTCVALHNLEKRLGSNFYEPYVDFLDDDEEEQNPSAMSAEPAAIQVLENLIQHFE